MPTLEFKGKQHIYAHHLTVPYRPLEPDEDRSCNPSDTEDNLIIHGDNLHALKALLPRYANRIKCIYIDPPYNTGNEGWVYNDNVNSPLMQQWFTENAPVDNEDLDLLWKATLTGVRLSQPDFCQPGWWFGAFG